MWPAAAAAAGGGDAAAKESSSTSPAHDDDSKFLSSYSLHNPAMQGHTAPPYSRPDRAASAPPQVCPPLCP